MEEFGVGRIGDDIEGIYICCTIVSQMKSCV